MGSAARNADWQSLVDLIYTEHVRDLDSLLCEVFSRYRRLANFSGGIFMPIDMHTGSLLTGVCMDHDPQLMAEYLQHYYPLDPYVINGPTLGTMNQVMVFTEVAARVPGFRHSEFTAFMQKVPYADALAVLLGTPARPVGVVSIHRTARMAGFSERDKHDFAWLVRHLSRGIDLRERSANIATTQGDSLLVVDTDGRILWLNESAQRLLDDVSIDVHWLRRIPVNGRQYRTQSGIYRVRCQPLGRDSIFVRCGLVAERKSQQPAPLYAEGKRPPRSQRSALLVTFTPVSPAVDLSGIFDSLSLTLAEERVAGLLLLGWQYGRIADHLGVRETTIRTHVYNMYSKAGVRTRHEFIAMMTPVTTGSASVGAV